MSVIGRIHSFESCGTVDGPGIRFITFFQGCLMRCLYCHNRDTWDTHGGKEVTVEEFKPTKEQEELIELGLMTLEEVMEANKPVGKKVNEVQVQKINIGGNYAKVLVNALDVNEKIENIKKVSKEDIISVSKKISIHTQFLLEASDEKNND